MFLALCACVVAPPAGAPADSDLPETDSVGPVDTAATDSEETDSVEPVDTAPDSDSALDTGECEEPYFMDSGDLIDTAGELDEAICSAEADLDLWECALTNPGPVDLGTMEDIRHAAWALHYLVYDLTEAFDGDWVCAAHETDGDSDTWEGPCVDDCGNAWEGAVSRSMDHNDTVATWEFQHVVTTTAGGGVYAWDGEMVYTLTAEGAASESALGFSIAGSPDPLLADGDYTIVGLLGSNNGYEYFRLALAQDGEDWCLQGYLSWWSYSDDCHNRDGWWWVDGVRSATLTETAGYADNCDCGCWDPSDGDPMAFCR